MARVMKMKTMRTDTCEKGKSEFSEKKDTNQNKADEMNQEVDSKDEMIPIEKSNQCCRSGFEQVLGRARLTADEEGAVRVG